MASSSSGAYNPKMPQNKSMKDIQVDLLPKHLKHLYEVLDVKNSTEALVLLLHSYMLEFGFIHIPRHSSTREELKLPPEAELLQYLPEQSYRFWYYHPTCERNQPVCSEACSEAGNQLVDSVYLKCSLLCIPLSSAILSVFGTIDHPESVEGKNTCLQVKKYINEKEGFSEMSKVYINVRKLSILFKDNYPYKMLAAMQDVLGFGPTFGLPSTEYLIQEQIVSYLPVTSILAVSRINKEFNELCNKQSLWKHLCMRDFKIGDSESLQKNTDWKELYKKKHMSRKKMRFSTLFAHRERMPSIDPLFPFPGIGPPFPFGPSFPFGPTFPYGSDVQPDFMTGMHAEVKRVFPQLKRRTNKLPGFFHLI